MDYHPGEQLSVDGVNLFAYVNGAISASRCFQALLSVSIRLLGVVRVIVIV